MTDEPLEDERCPYCGCELELDGYGEPIPHDHTDDSPHIDPAQMPRHDY